MSAESGPDRLGILVRSLVFLVGIGLFVVGWWAVWAKDGIDFSIVWWILGGCAAILVVTLAWIRWNLRIHAVKGPRRGVRDPGPLPPTDQLGREVVVVPGASTARRAVLDLHGHRIVIEPVES